jgi:hypothetical protein
VHRLRTRLGGGTGQTWEAYEEPPTSQVVPSVPLPREAARSNGLRRRRGGRALTPAALPTGREGAPRLAEDGAAEFAVPGNPADEPFQGSSILIMHGGALRLEFRRRAGYERKSDTA